MASPTEQIKERLNIVDVVGQYVKLTKAGKNFKGISPFTSEKTPSFFVSPDRGLYHCFSSGKGGDIFTFIQEVEGTDFQGALKMLAEQAGVTIKYESKEHRDERDRLYQLIEDAKQFYVSRLKSDESVQKYLSDRGMDQKSIQSWEIGYAPASWDEVLKFLEKKGYRGKEMHKVGLVKAREKGDGFYDVFRNRIMFPINDSAGRTVAFSGRIFPERQEKDREDAKYLNTPETDMFVKSRILFGYDRAKQSIRKNKFAILVEGQMDVIMSHQAGFPNTLAASGTAFTPEHIDLLKRLSSNLVMAFDADRAGIDSAIRASSLALAAGLDSKVARMPDGEDPATMVERDPEEWRSSVREAKHVVEFYLDILEEGESDARKRQLLARDVVLPLLAQIDNKMDQAHFISLVSSRLQMPESAVHEELNKIPQRVGSIPSPDTTKDERKAVYREDMLERELFGILKSNIESKALSDDTVKRITSVIGEEKLRALESNTAIHSELAFLSEIAYANAQSLEDEAGHVVADLTRERLKRQLQQATVKLRQAEAAGRQSEADELLKTCKALSEQLSQL